MWKNRYRAAILTVSDLGAAGARADESGPLLQKRLEAVGCEVVETALLPDEQAEISALLRAWCDGGCIDLILTTGGTGLARRDVTPEATLAVAERQVPGMAEAMRTASMAITPRGMLSRGVAATRGGALILNLPGSPKAAGECLDAVMPALEHALDTLCGHSRECAAQAHENS